MSSKFNGDISNWNTSKVKFMESVFHTSQFNGDISKWDVSEVTSMIGMFYKSNFNRDLSKWTPYNLIKFEDIFKESKCQIPYWSKYKDPETRKKSINSYKLNNELDNQLNENNIIVKKNKI